MAYSYGTTTNCVVANGQTRKEYECRFGYQVNSQSEANNTSNITLRLQVRSINSSYQTYGYNQTSKIDGTSLAAKSFDMRDTNTWKTFGERTITVTHGSDGSYSASKTGSFTTTATTGYSLKSGSASVTVKPAKINRYASITTFKNTSTGLTSADFQWTTDKTCDIIDYSLNGGNWVNFSSSGTFTVSNLSPNTTYKLKIRVRRKDTQQYTTSAEVSFTTKDIGRLTNYPSYTLGNNYTIQYSNPSGEKIQAGIYDTSGSKAYAAYRTVTGTSYTFTFTDNELDEMYKAMGNNNSVILRLHLNTRDNAYRDWKDIEVNLTGNQKTAHVNISGSWKRGKHWININGTWRRAVVWQNVNGTWKRGI